MIFASRDTYYTLGKYTKKKSKMSTALLYGLNQMKQKIEPELQETGVLESRKQEFLLAAASSYISRVTKGWGLETCGELTVFWQVIKIKAHQIFILGAISDFS